MRGLALVLLLAGCAGLQPIVNPVDAIVGEALAAARLPADEQSAVLSRAQEAGLASPVDRLRLATLLATLPAPLRDDARALELLEPLADNATSGIGRFAALLAAQVTERQRAVRELERVTREADRAARERAAADKERAAADKERTAADKERDKREEALKQQLESLRAIERGILEREEKMRGRPQ
ncbi:MAG TPA: hypothetical protein VJ690_00545 [Burkholderiales bacterium]|nr:hypothetical protein [Burkholderiales bacterium]